MAKSGGKPSKTKAASAAKNKQVAKLLALASGAPALSFQSRKSTARLFEVVVLADLILTYRNCVPGSSVVLANAPGGDLRFAGAPCAANKLKYSYFTLQVGNQVLHEAWVSVQFTTLSWQVQGAVGTPLGADRHEMDVGIFSPLAQGQHYPSFRQLQAGVSCKHFSPSKEAVREALGLRRESALLHNPTPSRVPWLSDSVPASPASPIYLASSSDSVYRYTTPIDRLGVFVAGIPFR